VAKSHILAGKERFVAGMFGSEDFMSALGVERTYQIDKYDFIRRQIAMQCTAHHIMAIDTAQVSLASV